MQYVFPQNKCCFPLNTFYSPRLITILNINADDYISLLLFQYLAPIGVKTW